MIAASLLGLLARRCAEELEAAERVATVGRGEAGEHRTDEPWLEDFLGSAETFTGGGESDVPHSRVGLGAVAHHVPLPHEAVDGEGHGGDSHAHVGGQLR